MYFLLTGFLLILYFFRFVVAPAELEDFLISHDHIVDSGFIEIPDERAGELPRAFVVKKQDSSLTEEEVEKFIRDTLSDYKRLRGGVQFMDLLPKSASFKLLRRILKDEYLTANKLK